jgi:glycosyltransferase involved in cell wall biosynthesis
VIVVDDGSTDATSESVQKLIRTQNGEGEKIRYFFQLNQGSSVARNKGIDEARGEWIAFLDSDDVWFPDKLKLQIEVIRELKGECSGCFTDAQMVNDLGMNTTSFRTFGINYDREVGFAPDALMCLAKSFCGFWLSTLLVRADLARRVNGFDPEIQGPEDRDFYFRVALATSLVCINKPMVRTDRSPSAPGSNCRPWDKWHVRLRSHQHMYEKWLGLGAALSPDVRKTVELDLRLVHSHWTNWYLAHEQYSEARQAVSNALYYGFTFSLAAKWMMTRLAPHIARKVTLMRGSDNAVYSR